eukprot:s2166_g12.t1
MVAQVAGTIPKNIKTLLCKIQAADFWVSAIESGFEVSSVLPERSLIFRTRPLLQPRRDILESPRVSGGDFLDRSAG